MIRSVMKIQLPSNSSDLNPLENLWVVIKKIVYIVTEILVRDCRTLVSSSETVRKCKVTGVLRCWILKHGVTTPR